MEGAGTVPKSIYGVLTACFVVVLSACGSDGRESIEGTVTFDGKPLAAGQIAFLPEPDTNGPSAGAVIKDGAFTIEPKGGTFAGRFRVEVTATRPSNRKMMNHETGQMVSVPFQFIPDKYNVQSQLTAEVKSGQENKFDLTSR